jgi:hypothetical protein
VKDSDLDFVPPDLESVPSGLDFVPKNSDFIPGNLENRSLGWRVGPLSLLTRALHSGRGYEPGEFALDEAGESKRRDQCP